MYVDSFWLNQRSKWLSVRRKKSHLILFGYHLQRFLRFSSIRRCSKPYVDAQRKRKRVSIFIRMTNYTRICTIAQMEKYNLCDVRVRGERTSVHYISIDFKCLCSLLIALPHARCRNSLNAIYGFGAACSGQYTQTHTTSFHSDSGHVRF